MQRKVMIHKPAVKPRVAHERSVLRGAVSVDAVCVSKPTVM